ncbi:hypothetical protein AAG906_014957 [Vitis piasezkii]
MGSKTVIKWSKQIRSAQVAQLIKAERDIQKAIVIFDSATAEYTNGFRHSHQTFSLMISRLVKCNITEDIFLSICRAYGRVHKPLDAVRVFRKMKEYECEPSQKSYITVFAILVGENQLKLALRFYRYMREMGIPPSVASLNVLIKALCKNSGTMDAALRIFREMPNRGCPPDSYTYGTLINGLCRLGKIGEAKELFKEMETKACSPTVVTYTSLIHGLCQSKDLDSAIRLLEEMASKGIKPNVFTYSSLMDGHCKSGCSSRALELLDMMVSKRHLPNMITYSTLVHGLCKEGKLQEAAANFLDEMVLGGISPNRLTWSLHVRIHNIVVQGLCTEHPNRAFQLYLSMRTRGISIDAKTFDSLVNYFCNKGDLHKAAHLVDEMVLDGCIPDEVTWNAVVGAFWDRRKVREAAELVQVELMEVGSTVGQNVQYPQKKKTQKLLVPFLLQDQHYGSDLIYICSEDSTILETSTKFLIILHLDSSSMGSYTISSSLYSLEGFNTQIISLNLST